MRVRGVLALQPDHPRWLLIPEQVQQLDTLARQIAIALERVREGAQETARTAARAARDRPRAP